MSNRRKIALFLGAGSSKAFGLPLTSEIFPLIIKSIKDKSLFKNDENERIELDDFINSLFPGLKNLKPARYPMITDILSLLDHSIINGNTIWNQSKSKKIDHYRYLFERALLDVLNVRLPQNKNGASDNKSNPLNDFTNWIFDNREQIHFSIISTNYDIVVEQVLYDKMRRGENPISQTIDFGITWRDVVKGTVNLRPQAPLMDIFKIHGSINWLTCNLCNHIYFNPYGSVVEEAYEKVITEYNTCHCGNAPLSSLIVAPSLARAIRDTNLPYIWNNALERLRTADEWIIIGYSLPPEDLNIKSMFMRAFNGRETKPKITVVQGSNKEIEPRYRAIFGEIEYLTDRLEGFIKMKLSPK